MLRGLYNDSHRNRLLGLSLVALHFSISAAEIDNLRAVLILVHFGLFLLWQPFWQRRREISPRSAGVLLLAALGLIVWDSSLPLAIWVLLLLGLLGGEAAQGRRDRLAHSLAISYLLIELLLGINPRLFSIAINQDLAFWIDWLAAVPAVLLVLVPAGRQGEAPRVDYLRALAVTSLALMLAGGSVLWMSRAAITYPTALLQTLAATALFILASNWVWRQQTNHSIFEVLWNRYLINLGTPFEAFLMRLSDERTNRLPPEEYLEFALEALATFDWVTGIAWRTAAGEEERVIGHRGGYPTRVESEGLVLTIYSRRQAGPMFSLHIQLLARLTQIFYTARQQSEELKKSSHLQAVYETGSRLTHDIKNLLQSMQSLTAAVEHAGEDQAQEALALLKRQMPELSRRLQLSLDRMKRPNVAADTQVRLDLWWQRLRERYHERGIEFQHNVIERSYVPAELFEAVSDNLISNALHKQRNDPSVRVQVSLAQVAGRVDFMVCDTGEAVDKSVAQDLFRQTVRSKKGLGIGLYQCQELANRYGYELMLAHNEDGRVCFSLAGRPDV